MFLECKKQFAIRAFYDTRVVEGSGTRNLHTKDNPCEKAKDGEQWGEGAKLLSSSHFPIRVLMRIVAMYILYCIHCYDSSGHIPTNYLSMWFVSAHFYYKYTSLYYICQIQVREGSLALWAKWRTRRQLRFGTDYKDITSFLIKVGAYASFVSITQTYFPTKEISIASFLLIFSAARPLRTSSRLFRYPWEYTNRYYPPFS